jgi:HPt (histidine-containing phosphotransfer) domain-containing protein
MLERLLAKAAEARAAADVQAVAAVAHQLKSSAGQVGALPLAARCAEIDKAIRLSTLVDLDAEVEALLAEGRNALAAVRAILEN